MMNRSRKLRLILALFVTTLVISGQVATRGALYGYSFSGLTFGAMSLNAGLTYFLLMGSLVFIPAIILIYGSALASIFISLIVSIHKTPSLQHINVLSWILATFGMACIIGLSLMSHLHKKQFIKGEVEIETSFYFWPLGLLILAGFYRLLLLTSKNAAEQDAAANP